MNTDHTCDSPEIKKIIQLQYGTVNQSPTQQTCVSQQAALHSVCMQSNNVAVRLYKGNGSDVSDHCAILSDNKCN